MNNDYEPNLGIYDMRRDTTGLPKSLANKINISICMKGGGGGGTTTVTKSGIDEEFKPYLERVLKDVTGRYESEVAGGPDSILAALTPEQEEALDSQKQAAYDKISGRGAYDMESANRRALKDLAGQQDFSSYRKGTFGSRRAMMARESALANRSREQQMERLKMMEEGIGDLGKVGTTKQKYAQERLDAPHTSAQRYFGYLSGAPQTNTQTSSGGGK